MKKIFRQIQKEFNRTPYYREEGLPDLTINFFINQRSAGAEEALQEGLFYRLKTLGFFNWYPGRKNKRGVKIYTCPFSSLYHHGKEFFKSPIQSPVRVKPFYHYITLNFEGKWVSAKVNGWHARFNTDTHEVYFKLINNKWVESHRNSLEDLPF